MKLFKFFLALSVLGSALTGHATHPYTEQLEAAKEASSNVRNALRHDFDQKTALCEDLDALTAFIQSSGQGVDAADLAGKIKGRLGTEQSKFKLYEDLIRPLSGGTKVTWSQKFQKMGFGLQDIMDTYVTEDNVRKVLSGEHIFDTGLTDESWPALLQTNATVKSPEFWGTTKVARYSVFLLAVAAQLMDPDNKAPVTGAAVLEKAGIRIDDAPVAHIVPLPALFNPATAQWKQYLGGSLFFVEDYMSGAPGLLMTGEFQFGGHRNVDESSSLEPRYPKGKRFGPHDASSLMAGIFEYPKLFATLYQSMFCLSHLEPEVYATYLSKMTDDAQKDVTQKVAELGEKFVAVAIQDMVAGDIFGYRTPNPTNPAAGPGHTGLFIGYSKEGNPVIFTGNRGLPQNQMDGIGLEEKVISAGALPFAMRAK